jgi:hypothetical protein
MLVTKLHWSGKRSVNTHSVVIQFPHCVTVLNRDAPQYQKRDRAAQKCDGRHSKSNNDGIFCAHGEHFCWICMSMKVLAGVYCTTIKLRVEDKEA